MKFYGNYTALTVKDGNESDTLVAAKFMQSENQEKFHSYVESVAAKLNEMEPFSDEMAAYLESVENKVRNAETAEKFLEEVAF